MGDCGQTSPTDHNIIMDMHGIVGVGVYFEFLYVVGSGKSPWWIAVVNTSILY